MTVLELKVPPVAVFLVCAAGMWLLARALPAAEVDLPYAVAAAAVILVAGLAVAAAGVLRFVRRGTTVHPSRPDRVSAFVHDGVYRYTRNPMYLGLANCLLAWGIYLQNAAAILWLAVFVAYMNRFQIRPEERVLREKFGVEFADYLSRTRRWL